METLADFIFLGSKITADSDSSHEIKRRLLLGRKVMIKKTKEKNQINKIRNEKERLQQTMQKYKGF